MIPIDRVRHGKFSEGVRDSFSAAQLLPKVKDGDWEGALRAKVERREVTGNPKVRD